MSKLVGDEPMEGGIWVPDTFRDPVAHVVRATCVTWTHVGSREYPNLSPIAWRAACLVRVLWTVRRPFYPCVGAIIILVWLERCCTSLSLISNQAKLAGTDVILI